MVAVVRPSICLVGLMRPTLCTTTMLQLISYVCVHSSLWVCETYDVHHLVSPRLCCAPPSCIVHHQSVLCTMLHKGYLCPRKVGVAPPPNIFRVFHVNHQKMKNVRGNPPLLMDIGPPCAPWCTTQVSGAQRRSQKPKWILTNVLSLCYAV